MTEWHQSPPQDGQLPLHVVSEYELLRVIETTSDADQLARALSERDKRLDTRAYSRNFWGDVFSQETRRLRDNLGGEFVTVKTGEYIVGNYHTPHSSLRRINVREPYGIGRFPVTESAYKRFVDEGGYADRELWDAAGWAWRQRVGVTQPWLWRRYPYDETRARYPMSGITWFEASAFCRWRSGRATGATEIRLPTPTEWECAARGRRGRRYPWGWSEDVNRANVAGTRYASRVAVNRFPSGVSPAGCWDMVGNVAEITALRREGSELYERVIDTLTEHDFQRRHRLAHNLLPVTLRAHGGGYQENWDHCRASDSVWIPPDERSRALGFRVVRIPAVQ